MEGGRLRQIILDVLHEEQAKIDAAGRGGLQEGTVLQATVSRARAGSDERLQQAILTTWHDLFRGGYIAWGRDLLMPSHPWCHLTEPGRELLKHLSRDPWNRDGYMNHLKSMAKLSDTAGAYVEEALATYSASCYRATTVMIGAAAERLALDLRDVMVERLKSAKRDVPKKLDDWRIKIVLNAIAEQLADPKHRATMPHDLRESTDAYWPAFAQQLRAARNEAGHPASLAPIRADMVHAAMLAFPELARIVTQLIEWAGKHYPQ